MEKRLLTKKEVAEYLGCSTKTIKRWVDRGLIPFWPMPGGRGMKFDKIRVDRWIERRNVKADADLW